MSLNIFSIFWGEQHAEMWKNAAVRSLSFHKNKAALYEKKATWHIFTEKKFWDYASRTLDTYFPEMEVIFHSKDNLRDYIDPVQSAAIKMIELCLKENKRLLIAPPDTIFADGAIDGLLSMGRDEKSCVVVPHPRVLPSILSESLQPSISSSELVRLAWSLNQDGSYKYLHRAWSEAEIGHPIQNSFVGGVAWKKIADRLYSIQHRLPTVYLADFTPDDLAYFKAQISFGGWDHTWPGDILVKRGRQRFVNNSDIAFIVEITDKDKNVPPIWPGPVDGFWRNHPHNLINAEVWSIFREG